MGGTLRLGQAGSDLIVHTAEGAALSLQSNVADENGGFFGLTKTGAGTLSMPRIPWTGRPVVVGGGTLELTGRDPLPYFVNTLDGVTATRETNVAVCARASLPVDFRPGAWLEIGACVLAVGGEPGARELVLDYRKNTFIGEELNSFFHEIYTLGIPIEEIVSLYKDYVQTVEATKKSCEENGMSF